MHACVVEDFENTRSATLRWLCGQPTDALLVVFSSGKSVLVPWDVNLAHERSTAGQLIPYTDFRRSFREAVVGVLRDNGTAAGHRVEFPGRTSHLRWKELQSDLPGLDVVLRSDGYESFIGKQRVVKDAAETEAIEKAASVTNALIEILVDTVSSRRASRGLRELDIAQLIEREALARGAEGVGFETLAAGPGRSWAIHPFPSFSAGPFATEGLSILDFGVKVDGYTSDVTLTVARGRLSAEQDRMIGLVKDAYAAAVAAARPGVSPQAPARAAEEVFTAAGWKMPHSLGHGIGLDTHEAPLLRSTGDAPDPALLPGMVFTIEPGLYDPDQGGVRWENDVIMTDTGARVLTKSRIIRAP